MGWIAGLGELAGIVSPFITTEDEKMEHEQYMKGVQAEIAQYQSQKEQAEIQAEKQSQMMKYAVMGVGVLALGIGVYAVAK